VVTVGAFSAFPFAVFLNDNRTEAELDPGIVLYWLVVFVIGLVAVFGADRLRGTNARERAAVVFATAVFVFFQFELVRSATTSLGFGGSAAAALGAWLGLFVAALAVVGWLSRYPAVRSYMVIVGVLLAAYPAIQFGYFKAGHSTSEVSGGGAARAFVPAPGDHPAARGNRPDVYFFLLDGYGRADWLEATLGYDGTGFQRSLERRGFEVHENAWSAYPITSISLTSTLQMSYPAQPGELGDLQRWYDAISGANETVRAFDEMGYRFVFATDYARLHCGDRADLCVGPREHPVDVLLGERELAILKATPLDVVLPKLGIRGSALTGFLSAEEVVEQVERERPDAPVFVYSHILSPHPPYRYLAGCELKSDIPDPSLIDWGPIEGSGGEGYLQAIECINRDLLAAVDSIVARQPSAIIVIEGDHGPLLAVGKGGVSRPLSAWSKAELQQRFAILNAQRLPRKCSQSGPRAGLAVNTFRFVLGCITGHDPDPLPLRQFMVDYSHGRVERVSSSMFTPVRPPD
jgi:hypothetical protein